MSQKWKPILSVQNVISNLTFSSEPREKTSDGETRVPQNTCPYVGSKPYRDLVNLLYLEMFLSWWLRSDLSQYPIVLGFHLIYRNIKSIIMFHLFLGRFELLVHVFRHKEKARELTFKWIDAE